MDESAGRGVRISAAERGVRWYRRRQRRRGLSAVARGASEARRREIPPGGGKLLNPGLKPRLLRNQAVETPAWFRKSST